MNDCIILRYYQYLESIKSKNGMKKQNKLTSSYSDLDFLNTILNPDDLEKTIAKNNYKKT